MWYFSFCFNPLLGKNRNPAPHGHRPLAGGSRQSTAGTQAGCRHTTGRWVMHVRYLGFLANRERAWHVAGICLQTGRNAFFLLLGGVKKAL